MDLRLDVVAAIGGNGGVQASVEFLSIAGEKEAVCGVRLRLHGLWRVSVRLFA